jgi:hypothetical protein
MENFEESTTNESMYCGPSQVSVMNNNFMVFDFNKWSSSSLLLTTEPAFKYITSKLETHLYLQLLLLCEESTGIAIDIGRAGGFGVSGVAVAISFFAAKL